VAISQLISLVLLAPVLIVHGVAPLADPRLLFACLAGLGVTVELRLVYLAISRGDAFITAPVGALGAMLAVLVGLLGGDRISDLIALGLVCALLGGGLSAWRPSAANNLVLCLGAAVGVATMLSSFHAAGRVDPYWATTVVTASTAVPAGAFALAGDHRLPPRGQLPALTLVAFAGLAGDLAYAAASRGAALSIVSAIASLYPLSTITLGMVVQGQRSTRLQTAGIVLALAGAALLGVRA
jgi:drug/metabolite transporter (DMT)-like permease